MSIAETAELAVNLHLGTTGSFAGATSQINALQSGVLKAETAVSRFGGALGHAKGAIGGLLTGPLGVLGLAGGIGGIGIAFGKAIEHTNDFAFTVEKLTGLTGASAESMSTLLAVFEKYNISAERTGMIVGFAEKTLGKLAATSTTAGKSAGDLAKAQDNVTKAHEKLRVAILKLNELEAKGGASASQLAAARYKVRDATAALNQAENKLADDRKNKGAVSVSKLIELDKQYGLHLIDSKGKIADFDSELKQVADVYISTIDPARKAALAALLFGRGYADLVPILNLGSKGISEAEQAAKDLGLTLTSQNATDLKDYREALRETGDAIGGLELQIGLAAVPAIKDLANAITSFLRTGGRDKVVAFFKDMVQAGREFAGFITGSVVPTISGLASAATTFWNAIPGPLRDMLLKGFVADRTIKFLFGFSPISFATGALAKVLGGFGAGLLSRGGSPATPMWVASVNGGIGGGIPGVAGAAGAGISAAALAGLVAAAGALLLGSEALRRIINPNTSGDPLQTRTPAMDAAHLRNQVFNQPIPVVVTGPAGNVTPDFSRLAVNMGKVGNLTPQISRLTGQVAALGSPLDRVVRALDAAHVEFRRAAAQLSQAKTGAEIRKAIEAVNKSVFGKGIGGSGGASALERELRRDLANTHDPKLAADLRTEIRRLHDKVLGRHFEEGEFRKFDAVYKSSESAGKKIHDLQKIANDVGAKDRAQGLKLQGRIDALKTELHNKKLAVTIPITNVSNVTVNSRSVNTSQQTYARYMKTPT